MNNNWINLANNSFQSPQNWPGYSQSGFARLGRLSNSLCWVCCVTENLKQSLGCNSQSCSEWKPKVFRGLMNVAQKMDFLFGERAASPCVCWNWASPQSSRPHSHTLQNVSKTEQSRYLCLSKLSDRFFFSCFTFFTVRSGLQALTVTEAAARALCLDVFSLGLLLVPHCQGLLLDPSDFCLLLIESLFPLQ